MIEGIIQSVIILVTLVIFYEIRSRYSEGEGKKLIKGVVDMILEEIHGDHDEMKLFSCVHPKCQRRKTCTSLIESKLFNIGRGVYEKAIAEQEEEVRNSDSICGKCSMMFLCSERTTETRECQFYEEALEESLCATCRVNCTQHPNGYNRSIPFAIVNDDNTTKCELYEPTDDAADITKELGNEGENGRCCVTCAILAACHSSQKDPLKNNDCKEFVVKHGLCYRCSKGSTCEGRSTGKKACGVFYRKEKEQIIKDHGSHTGD